MICPVGRVRGHVRPRNCLGRRVFMSQLPRADTGLTDPSQPHWWAQAGLKSDPRGAQMSGTV